MEADLAAVRDLCNQLDVAKEQLSQQMSGLETEKMRVSRIFLMFSYFRYSCLNQWY